MTIDITVPATDDGLYAQFPGQTGPQRVFMDIDPQAETVLFDYTGDVGTPPVVPEYVYNRRILRVWLPMPLRASAAREWAESEYVQTLLRVICEGHDMVWGGSNNLGRLSVDARFALAKLERSLADEIDWADCGITGGDDGC